MANLSLEARQILEKPFALLAESLQSSLKSRRMIFMQNDGNYGDSLIRYGTLKFFEDLGLTYREFDMGRYRDKLACVTMGLLDRVTDKYLFVYGGNGAWAVVANSGYRNVRRQRRFTPNVFLLPTTFEHYEFDFDFPAFARDRFQSKAFLKGGPFCHDMAFYLALIQPERMLPNRRPPEMKVGLILRTDNESRGLLEAEKWPQNIDISQLGGHRSDPQEFLRRIDRFEHVITDRLHVAIGAALLDKKVTLLSGNYFKIKAIYESSMAGIFNNVEFIENPSKSLIEDFKALAA